MNHIEERIASIQQGIEHFADVIETHKGYKHLSYCRRRAQEMLVAYQNGTFDDNDYNELETFEHELSEA